MKFYDPSTIEQSVVHYRVLGCRFYEDGLESVYPIARCTDLDTAWNKVIEAMRLGECPLIWAYDSEDANDYQAMYVEKPYPTRWTPTPPDWVRNALARKLD